MRRLIEQRIRELLEDTDPRFGWLRDKVREAGFLPLVVDMVTTYGIRPDLTLVCWDDGSDAVVPLEDGPFARAALVRGARKYPELAALIPARPPDAVLCGSCGGSGGLPGPHDIICACGGVGWALPGET